MQIDRRTLGLLAAAAIAAAGVAYGLRGFQEQATGKPPINVLDSPSGAAIKGYDPVAYFVDGGPRKGRDDLAVTHAGAKWLFSTPENKARFEQDPDKFVPAYGGYCAYGVAQGSLVKIEPDAWSIRDGRLYLNYDAGVQETWAKDPAGYIETADAKWPDLVAPR